MASEEIFLLDFFLEWRTWGVGKVRQVDVLTNIFSISQNSGRLPNEGVGHSGKYHSEFHPFPRLLFYLLSYYSTFAFIPFLFNFSNKKYENERNPTIPYQKQINIVEVCCYSLIWRVMIEPFRNWQNKMKRSFVLLKI